MTEAVWLDALAGTHDRLSDLVSELDDASLLGKSYCAEWTIAQVFSHLGSGAEILGKTVDAAVAEKRDLPGRSTRRSGRAGLGRHGPAAGHRAGTAHRRELVERLEHLGGTLEGLEFMLSGSMRADAEGLLRVRLGEHAVHT